MEDAYVEFAEVETTWTYDAINFSIPVITGFPHIDQLSCTNNAILLGIDEASRIRHAFPTTS